MGTLNAHEVAAYIIGYANDGGELLTNLKLQKLLYYAQGWHLAHFGSRLFDERIEAWAHGPVVPNIYHIYKGKRWNPINSKVTAPKLPANLKEWLNRFLEAYLLVDAFQLEQMTHRELPWREARGNIPIDALCTKEIKPQVMKTYFKSLLNGQKARQK